MNNDDDIPTTVLTRITTVLTQITDALKLHDEVSAEHRNSIEQLIQENVELKKRLAKLEATDSSNYSNAKFIADITNRLAAISSAINSKS